jgi:NAD(P)-dependent dehydrogenase (short-subunit alcohol dehydrogenase family)
MFHRLTSCTHRVAFVTGAGGALGRAIVLQFARDGVTRIAGVDLSERTLAETAAVLHAEFPGVEFLTSLADISNEEQIQATFRQIVDKFGRIDYAVNNAAIGSPFVTTGDAELKDFERIQSVNVKGTWLCQREELRQMAKQVPLVSEGSAA